MKITSLLILAVLLLGGCAWFASNPVGPQTTIDTTHTAFATPTTVPSVSPSLVEIATTSGDAQTGSLSLYSLASTLTPANVAAVQADLLKGLTNLIAKIRVIVADVAKAQATAQANDAAVVNVKAERDEARSLVATREAENKKLAETHAADNAANAATIAKLQSDADAKDRAEARMIFGIGVSLGLLATIAGVLLVIWVTPKTAGVTVGIIGAVSMACSLAGLYYGRQLALVGLSVVIIAVAAAVVGAIWAAIHYLRADGASIAEGVQQAINAGKLKLADVATIFEQAQTDGAKKLVNLETDWLKPPLSPSPAAPVTPGAA